MTLFVDLAARHAARRPACRGYTLGSSDAASCGNCGWGASRRPSASGDERAVYALALLGSLGVAVALVTWASEAGLAVDEVTA